MSHAKEIFNRIIAEAQESQVRPIAVFDLDSTLFDVSPRTQNILHAFLARPDIQSDHTKEVEILKNLKILSQDWGLRQAIERVGLKSSEVFHRKIRDFWRKNFFSSDFLVHDRPYDGAIEYVKALAAQNIEIYYLTGRDEENMKRGTIEVLAKWGLPLLSAHTHLIMKPIKGSVEDADFKVASFRDLVAKNQGASFWFFDNEPVIIEKVLAASLPVNVVFVDTTHSGRSVSPTGLPVITVDGWRL